MNLIVAVDENWAIGLNNRLLVSIPSDMKFFREITTGKVVVMGRKTLEALPGGQPLKNRVNIVLSRDMNYRLKDAIVVHSVEDALEILKEYDTEDIYCIGGESIYKAFLPFCDTAHVTYIENEYEADTYFPNLDKSDDWYIAADADEQTYFDITYTFRMYKRRS